MTIPNRSFTDKYRINHNNNKLQLLVPSNLGITEAIDVKVYVNLNPSN